MMEQQKQQRGTAGTWLSVLSVRCLNLLQLDIKHAFSKLDTTPRRTSPKLRTDTLPSQARGHIVLFRYNRTSCSPASDCRTRSGPNANGDMRSVRVPSASFRGTPFDNPVSICSVGVEEDFGSSKVAGSVIVEKVADGAMVDASASAAASRVFIGSTMLPQVTFTDEDAREYRSVADESFRETRALYEDFLYTRNQTLDSRRWKHVRTKGAMKVYRQRSSSIDSNFNSTPPALAVASSTSSATVSSTSSPDPLDVDDDALLIGPASSLSVGTKIPVVVCTGTVQGTVDDVMYGIFVHDTPSLRRRSIYGKDGMDDLVMLGTLEGPTEANPFDFLGVAWILYSAPGLGAIVKQRDYVVLMRTGFATTSRGERIGYSIAQSVSHPDLPELKHLGIVRASMSFCVVFRQQSSQMVESFAHAVIDPGGAVLSFFVLQEIASSILGVGAPMECAQGKRLRWYLHKKSTERRGFTSTNVFDTSKSSPSLSSSVATERTTTTRTTTARATESGDPSVCSYCRKSIGKIFSAQRVLCAVCHECVCKRCSVSKNLVVPSSHAKTGMKAQSYHFCLGCFLASKDLSTEDIQRGEVVYKRLDR